MSGFYRIQMCKNYVTNKREQIMELFGIIDLTLNLTLSLNNY